MNFEFGKYTYRIIVVILACILKEERMARASKFLRESESGNKPKSLPKRKPIKKNKSP
jgi:hypothetical protein